MPVVLLNKGTDSTPQKPAVACTETTSDIFYTRIYVIFYKDLKAICFIRMLTEAYWHTHPVKSVVNQIMYLAV